MPDSDNESMNLDDILNEEDEEEDFQ